jgi:microcompartment protein CcmL/EutN
VLESFSIAVLIEAADVTVKTAEVHLLQIALGMAIGGKAYVTLTGDISAVKAAIDAGAKIIAERGMLVYQAVIPAPLWTSYLDIEGMENIQW